MSVSTFESLVFLDWMDFGIKMQSRRDEINVMLDMTRQRIVFTSQLLLSSVCMNVFVIPTRGSVIGNYWCISTNFVRRSDSASAQILDALLLVISSVILTCCCDIKMKPPETLRHAISHTLFLNASSNQPVHYRILLHLISCFSSPQNASNLLWTPCSEQKSLLPLLQSNVWRSWRTWDGQPGLVSYEHHQQVFSKLTSFRYSSIRCIFC